MRAKPGQAYRDRREAGEILAAHLQDRLGRPANAVVRALPRGGVPVGFEVARVLDAELDVFVVRKLGMPGHEEFAMGAIAAGGFELLNEQMISELGLSEQDIAAVAEKEAAELRRREELYRANRPAATVQDRITILVDDGLATGFSMRAAIAAVRERGPSRLVVAVPVGARETCAEIEREVGLLFCPLQPEPFHAVGLWYHDFAATSDEEVRDCLVAADLNHHAVRPRG
jgi:putative phosphoribosyl transferase